MKVIALTFLSYLATKASAQGLRHPFIKVPQDEGSSCACQSDYDCQNPVCIFSSYSEFGICGGGRSGAASCMCQSDYDCQKPVCVFDPYSQIGTCGGAGPTSPTRPPTQFPSFKPAAPDCCIDTRHIPTKCEVDILIEMLDIAIASEHRLSPQWLRLSFHDAGTFNVTEGKGGANGCLMTDALFPAQAENAFLDVPINTLRVNKMAWEAHPDTCITISAADIIQFAGLFAALRQVPPAGIDSAKRDTLMKFEWGRPDEVECDVDWVDNLPGFRVTDPPFTGNIPFRCMNAGGEIKHKMMDTNGFTAQEAVALIGAHTIGKTRSSFHVSFPWVKNGDDDAEPTGPVFDNSFHDFLINEIVANDAFAFSANIDPFDIPFSDWFLENDTHLSHLDTDIAIAFESQDLTVHPHFHNITKKFAHDNAHFLEVFFLALDKMSRLGVLDELLHPPTECTPCDGDGVISEDTLAKFGSDLDEAMAAGEESLRLKRESEELSALRERDTVPLKESDILTIDEAVAQIEKIQSATVKEEGFSK